MLEILYLSAGLICWGEGGLRSWFLCLGSHNLTKDTQKKIDGIFLPFYVYFSNAYLFIKICILKSSSAALLTELDLDEMLADLTMSQISCQIITWKYSQMPHN